MSSVTEIEDALRKLPREEALNVAERLRHRLKDHTLPLIQGTPTSPEDFISQWRGKGRLPVGTNVDDFLTFNRG